MSKIKNLSENELIAVISAAVNSIIEGTGKRFAIKSFRRVGQSSPVWRMAGKLERLKII
ncbi:MAG TPA: sodium pump decarboxylase subunit gamma [Clostridiaceae bacterium]|nr:sodium pump decarboxylase subunit gamma [Clostridiaceae bacterium]